MKKLIACIIIVSSIGLSACTRQQAGTAGGALIGAGVGNAVGGTTGTLIGAGAGALIGNRVSR